MAKKKYYAVRGEHLQQIFESWDACKAAITGQKGVQYKGFWEYAAAERFLAGEEDGAAQILPPADTVIAYVDGSYSGAVQKYAFGCVLITAEGTQRFSGNGANPQSLQLRNVAGEMLGAMFAVRWALRKGYAQIELRYDYEGIEKWVSGAWKTKTALTAQYAAYMRNMSGKIQIRFRKVAAHTNDHYNDAADALAKDALIHGNGIPDINQ